MADKLISAEDLKKAAYNVCSIASSYTDGLTYSQIYTLFQNLIKAAPEIDATPVVRCKDCKNCGEFWESNYAVCKLKPLYGDCATTKNDFCSNGERKDGADNG